MGGSQAEKSPLWRHAFTATRSAVSWLATTGAGPSAALRMAGMSRSCAGEAARALSRAAEEGCSSMRRRRSSTVHTPRETQKGTLKGGLGTQNPAPTFLGMDGKFYRSSTPTCNLCPAPNGKPLDLRGQALTVEEGGHGPGTAEGRASARAKHLQGKTEGVGQEARSVARRSVSAGAKVEECQCEESLRVPTMASTRASCSGVMGCTGDCYAKGRQAQSQHTTAEYRATHYKMGRAAQ